MDAEMMVKHRSLYKMGYAIELNNCVDYPRSDPKIVQFIEVGVRKMAGPVPTHVVGLW